MFHAEVHPRTGAGVVTLPADHPPVFPEHCVGCCMPATTARRHTIVRTGWWQIAAPIVLPGQRCWVPYCDTCAARTRRRLLIVRAVAYPSIYVLIIISYLLARQIAPSPQIAYAATLVFFLSLAFPIFLWTAAWRPPFDALARGGTVEYRFRNSAYARAFARLNDPDTLDREEDDGPADADPDHGAHAGHPA